MKSAALVILACVSYASAACPNIVSRAEWGARAPTNVNYHGVPVPYVVIHHGAGGACNTPDDCAAVVRSVQNFHMDSNGWSDIGYSFLVGGDGNVYEGRGWDAVGAHAPGYNGNSQGINFLGDFVSQLPNDVAVAAAKLMIECGIGLGKISADYSLIGHRQAVATQCPGDALYALIQTWDHWTPNP